MSDAEIVGKVERKESGAVHTIHCKSLEDNNSQLYLKKGIEEETSVFVQDRMSGQPTINDAYKGRLDVNGKFPNMEIVIKNLTTDDTGPYWCKYAGEDAKKQMTEKKGLGSVLLVVTGESLLLTSQKLCCL